MQGKIIKGIGGFYYIHVEHHGIYECKAKGVFRNRKIKPLVGDNVDIDILSEADKKGNIREILPRTNELIRPAVANIDQALVFFAAAEPDPNLGLLDRFLLQMEHKEIPTIIGFNKCDLILSGHMHNGCLPYWFSKFINKTFKTSRSIISPLRTILPKYSQGKIYNDIKDGFVYEGINKLSKCTKNFHKFDFIYSKNIQLLTIKKNTKN